MYFLWSRARSGCLFYMSESFWECPAWASRDRLRVTPTEKVFRLRLWRGWQRWLFVIVGRRWSTLLPFLQIGMRFLAQWWNLHLSRRRFAVDSNRTFHRWGLVSNSLVRLIIPFALFARSSTTAVRLAMRVIDGVRVRWNGVPFWGLVMLL